MLFILDQRLKAQKIPEAKSQKVIWDIVTSMFSSKFVEELFVPQEIYSISSTRQIFERLAHSSIMRLNESSMDKLFDLMTMGFKSQVMWCSCPEEILQICFNHHDAIREMVGTHAEVLSLLAFCETHMLDAYGELPPYHYQQLREELLNYFLERKVKISLFLQDETQTLDGAFVIPTEGTLPVHVAQPGLITYSDGRQVSVKLANGGFVPNAKMDARISDHRYSTLGTNIYIKNKERKRQYVANSPNHRRSRPKWQSWETTRRFRPHEIPKKARTSSTSWLIC